MFMGAALFKMQTKGEGILDPDAWSDAHPEIMYNTFAHLRNVYGGIESYLDRIGFRASDRERLRTLLLKGDHEY